MSESRRIIGRWRITEMDNWDQEAVDLVKPGFIEFDTSSERSRRSLRKWLPIRSHVSWRRPARRAPPD
jgi:hypothetical protein